MPDAASVRFEDAAAPIEKGERSTGTVRVEPSALEISRRTIGRGKGLPPLGHSAGIWVPEGPEANPGRGSAGAVRAALGARADGQARTAAPGGVALAPPILGRVREKSRHRRRPAGGIERDHGDEGAA